MTFGYIWADTAQHYSYNYIVLPKYPNVTILSGNIFNIQCNKLTCNCEKLRDDALHCNSALMKYMSRATIALRIEEYYFWLTVNIAMRKNDTIIESVFYLPPTFQHLTLS